MINCPKIGFFGSGSFAERCLRLISEKVKPEWVITKTPQPAGRGMKERATTVQSAAESLGIPVFTTANISNDEERLIWINENLPALILVIDFGQRIREPLLSMARLGCYNIHPSMLPAYRGSAPVQRALLDGLSKTGVTVFRLEAAMDAGPVLAQREVEIDDGDNSETLQAKCAGIGCELFLQHICGTDPNDWRLTPQPEEGVSLAPKIEKHEAQINWNESALKNFNKIRAMYPSPIAYTTIKGKRMKILSASIACGEGSPGVFVREKNGFPLVGSGGGLLLLGRVQPEGKSAQSASDWLRGAKLTPGEKLF